MPLRTASAYRAPLVSSDDDSPIPATRTRRVPQSSLARVLAPSLPSPETTHRAPGQTLSTEALRARSAAVDARANALNRDDGMPSQCAPTDAIPLGADVLGISDHLQQLAKLASPPPGDEDVAAALAEALDTAVQSLKASERQSLLKLERSVEALKDEFRGRLEHLEAEFVRRAEGLSDELADAVATRKNSCAAEVSQHAEVLAERIVSIRKSHRSAAGGEVGADDQEDSDDEGWARHAASRGLLERGMLVSTSRPGPRAPASTGVTRVASVRTVADGGARTGWWSDSD